AVGGAVGLEGVGPRGWVWAPPPRFLWVVVVDCRPLLISSVPEASRGPPPREQQRGGCPTAMTLDVHPPPPADVDPLGEGLSARRCRQQASERDKSQQFHDDVFHGCSPFAFNSPARRPATSTNHTQSFAIGRGAETLMQSNGESRYFSFPAEPGNIP